MKKGMISILAALTGAAVGAGAVEKIKGEKFRQAKAMSDKHLQLFKLMTQWVKVKQQGKNLASYFEAQGYKKIAIYGMSFAGEALLDELRDSEIAVAYGIDKNAEALYTDVDIVTMEDALSEVDAIVVTAVTFFGEIEEKLAEKTDCPVISLEDILYNM